MRTSSTAWLAGTCTSMRMAARAVSVEPSPAGTGTAEPAAAPIMNPMSSAPRLACGRGPGTIAVLAMNAKPRMKVVVPEAISSVASDDG